MTDSSRTWMEDFQCAAVSDIGKRRTNNQDSYVLLPATDEETWLKRGHLFVVADGMGAHAAGELASKLAVDGVCHHYRKQLSLSPPEAVLQAMRDTNGEIHQRGQANTEFHNMGTTCSVLLLLPQGALVAHVGDSRVYRVRGKRVEQLTFDHSLLWEMRASGKLGSGDVANIPKNVITRSLGPQASVQIDLEGPSDIRVGDRFLLCSDGLTARLSDQELGTVTSMLSPDDAAQLLVDLVNLRGGPDNVTVLIVHAKGPSSASTRWRVEPLLVGQVLEPPRYVHLAVWITMAVALLVAAGLCVLDQFLWAMMAASIAALAAVIALWQFFRHESGVALTSGRRLGRSPYAAARIDVTPASVRQLSETVSDAIDGSEDWAGRERATACIEEALAKSRAGELAEGMKLLSVAARLAAEGRC